MRKIYIIVFFSLIVIQGNATDLRKCVLMTAQSQIGVKEEKPNGGKRIDAYLATTKLKSGYAWCSSFCNWVFLQCGVPGTNSAWAPSWFVSRKLVYFDGSWKGKPKGGDIFGIHYSGPGRIAHVGFIEKWEDNKKYFVSIEGNTNIDGSREGDGVYRKFRLKRQIFAIANWIDPT